MKQFNHFLIQYKKQILLIYLFLQPIIDLITSLCLNLLQVSFTLGMIIRFGFLAFLFYDFLISKTKTKKQIGTYLSIICMYMFLFTIQTFLLKGMDCLFYEVQNLIRSFYFPISFILLINFLESENIEIESKKWVWLFFVYIILIFIPTITNTGFNGYTQGKVGNIGWFHSSNEISAILSLLLPLFTDGMIKNKNKLITLMGLGITLYVLLNLGSKIVILSLGLIIVYYGYQYLKKWLRQKEMGKIGILVGSILLGVIVISFLLPRTNFYKNIETHLDFLEVNHITEVVTNPQVFDHFVFSSRLTFLKNTAINYQHSHLSEKILGIGYIENYGTDQVSLKTIEMDPFDIFFRHGILGFIIYFLPFVGALIKIYHQKEKQNTQRKIMILSIIIGILLMNLSGHVLTSPAVSIYLSLMMALLICEKNNPKQKKKSRGAQI